MEQLPNNENPLSENIPISNEPEKSENPESLKLQEALGKVMTAEEYSKLEHETPYLYELKADGKELIYFGAYHSRNPEDHIFDDIKNQFEQISPDLVLVEGLPNIDQKRQLIEEKIAEHSKDDLRGKVIDAAGESGFVLLLAAQKGVACESPEPEDGDMYNALIEQGFSKDDIFAQQVFLLLPQYNRQIERTGFEGYVGDAINKFEETTNWNGFDYSYEHALGVANGLAGKAIDVENSEHAADYVDPIPWESKKDAQTAMNKISRSTNEYRDKFMVSEIAKALQTHKKIFVVFGASHAVMQEPALKELFQ